MIMANLKCDRGTCFARNEFGNCSALNEVPKKGTPCKFQKERREYTNGIQYPYVKPNGGVRSV